MSRVIYLIHNVVNGKVYVGQTKDMRGRIRDHFRSIYYPSMKMTCLCKAILKYGKEAFSWEEIDKASSREEADIKEKWWIAFYDSCDGIHGYNMTKGGEGGLLTEEALDKIRQALRGRKSNPDAVAKMRASLKGRKLSPEWKAKIGASRIGRRMSQETREKISTTLRVKRTPAWNRGRPHSEETRRKISEKKRERDSQKRIVP